MWDWIAKIEDPVELDELATEARASLANPFTTRWGREHMEYQLHDANERLAQLAHRGVIRGQERTVSKERLCAECGEQIRQIDGLWRHVESNRICKDGLSQRPVIGGRMAK